MTETTSTPGRLVLVGTPLGNRGDLSPRAREAILSADLLLCEDTRSPARLLGPDVELPRRVSCFVGNEHERVELLLRALSEGKVVAFVSEAGLPVWSDPGRLLVEAAVGAAHQVDVIPGPTAAAVALAASGFDATRARFWGFLPRAGPERKAAVAQLAADDGVAILYEAGNRVAETLGELAAALPDAAERRLLIARELTKVHQELLRGTVSELCARTREGLRGEVTLVIQGSALRPAHENAGQKAALGVLEAVLDPGLRPRERAKVIAGLTGLDAREVYDRLTRDR